MKITGITAQLKDPNRVNVMVDGKYRFSLDITQLSDLGIKTGGEYSAEQLSAFETESQFGKLYARALEYSLMRPHSSREVRDYLYRKTLTRKYKSRTGEVKDRPGISRQITDRVFEKLVKRGYVDDENFAKYWIENRNLVKGASRRKIQAELAAKGVDRQIVDRLISESERHDEDELRKVIAKKRSRYQDDQKLMQYLARQGFSYEDIKSALSSAEE